MSSLMCRAEILECAQSCVIVFRVWLCVRACTCVCVVARACVHMNAFGSLMWFLWSTTDVVTYHGRALGDNQIAVLPEFVFSGLNSLQYL